MLVVPPGTGSGQDSLEGEIADAGQIRRDALDLLRLGKHASRRIEDDVDAGDGDGQDRRVQELRRRVIATKIISLQRSVARQVQRIDLAETRRRAGRGGNRSGQKQVEDDR